jgi:hypothetical protein
MNTKAKANSVITTSVAEDKITFNVLGAGSVTLDLGLVNPAIAKRAMFHGLIQRISDAAALSRNTETGLSASPSDKLSALRELTEHYNSGTSEWSLKRSGSQSNEGGLLVQALLRAFPGKTPERIKEYVKGLKVAERNALLASESIAPIVAELRSQATKGIDAEALIAGL